MITASIDPTIMLLNKSSLRKYIPEVFYTYKNEFNTIIKKNAVDGFPVDYLIVSLTHGFPNTKSNKLHISFPIENRKTQSLSKFDGEMLNDFHFILFLLKQDILDQETVSILFNVVNKTSKLDELVCRDSWMNLIAIVDGVKNDGGRNSSRKKDVEWGCRHCTFFNHGTDICEMCGLPSD